VQCLELLAKEEPHKGLSSAVQKVQTDVEAGASLAESMSRQPQAFNLLFTHMVAAGESAGILDTIFKRLSTYIEKQVKLQAQVKSAMIYPIAVVVIAAIVVGVLLWKVIPTFASLFDGLGAKLPLATRIVIRASELFVFALPAIIGGMLLGSFLIKRYYGTAAGRLRIDGLLLRVPLLGPILRKVAVARFCRTLSTLISSGVPILTGLDITGRTAGNAVVEAAIKQARNGIERGETIAVPLRATGVFPPMVTQMIGAGENTGSLDLMLAKIAEFYEEEVDVAVAGLLTVLEPVMIAVLGVIVGGIIISMYLPLFELINQLA
jgi:type IV pilus assembly protein PilC